MQTEVALVEEVAEVSVARQEQIRGHHDSDLHVDGQDLTCSSQVVDQDHQLHPAFPLVRLVSTQYRRLQHHSRHHTHSNSSFQHEPGILHQPVSLGFPVSIY